MKTGHRACRRNGSAIFTVVVLILVLSTVIGVVVAASAQRSFGVRRLLHHTRALTLAEAGANEAYNRLRADWSARTSDDAFPATPFGGGFYDVTVRTLGEQLAIVTSVGVYRGVTNTVVVDVAKAASIPGSTVPPNEAFGYAILSGGDMTWNGSGLTDVAGGRIHTNGKFKMTGCSIGLGTLSACGRLWSTGSSLLDGDTDAPSYRGKSPGNVTGTARVGAVPAVTIPPIDLTPYYAEAMRNGQAVEGDVHWSRSTDTVIPGGILWVNGDFKFSGSGDIVGCVIATGDVDYSGSGDQLKVAAYPAFVSRDGDIDFAGSGSYHGLFYAPNGRFNKTGSGAITGSIICGGVFDKAGSWDAFAYEDSTPVPPGSSTSPQDGPVYVSAWQK